MKKKRKNPAAVALGKLSGKVWTEKKREASRRNGKKGGRPRKKPVGDRLVTGKEH